MKIVGLGGSLRKESLTYQTLQLAMQKLSEHHVEMELIDLRTMQLPFCNGDAFYPNYPDVQKLREKIQSATAVLLATPEYHGNLSGVLKNALDLLEEEDIAGKVVGLIAVVGGVHSTNALNSMRLICRQLHCWVLPEQMIIPNTNESFVLSGDFKDIDLEKRFDQFLERLVAAARRHL